VNQTTSHRTSIRAPAGVIRGLCWDAEQWPSLFAPCLRVECLEKADRWRRDRITADAAGTPMTWESERWLEDDHTIHFRQTRPQWPVKAMEGTWRLTPASTEQSLLLLQHTVAVDETDPNAAQHLERIVRVIHANSTQELRAIKERAERRPQLTFSDRGRVPGSAQQVYQLLYRAEGWVDLLPHCSGMEVRYDDGRHQELCMRVSTLAGVEEIRTVRYGNPPDQLCYFQPDPPAPLATHFGSWQLSYPVGEGVEVVGSHTICLRACAGMSAAEERAELERVGEAIRANTRATLKALARRCGGQAD
jgi:aromatase